MGNTRFVTLCGVAALLLVSPTRAVAESVSKTVHVSATILPRLELSVAPATGDAIVFGAIEQPAAGDVVTPPVRVAVDVFSNLGSPYHVTQTVRRPLTNRTGDVISDGHFRVRTADAAQGQLGAARPTAIEPGTLTLYRSNEIGKNDAFTAEYTLTVTPQTPAGEYDAEVVYTVTTL